MAVPEAVAQGEGQYKEPSQKDLRWAKISEIPSGWRMHSIYMGVVRIEPVQEGVLRYPPVQIDVPRRSDYITRYIDMPNQPTDWSEVFGDKSISAIEHTNDSGVIKLPDSMR